MVLLYIFLALKQSYTSLYHYFKLNVKSKYQVLKSNKIKINSKDGLSYVILYL